jgi:hypothetical protein
VSFEIDRPRPKSSYVDFLNLGVNWQQKHQLSGISGQLGQMQKLQLIGTSQVLGKLENVSSSLSNIGWALNEFSSIQWQILSHFKEEEKRQEILGRIRLNLHNVRREVVMLSKVAENKPFYAYYQIETLLHLLESSGWKVEHFARESFADLQAAQEVWDLLEESGRIILDKVGASNSDYGGFEIALNKIYTLLHEKAIRKLEIEEVSAQWEFEYEKAMKEAQLNDDKIQQFSLKLQQMERIMQDAGLDVNSDKKLGFFKQLSVANKLMKSGNADIYEKFELFGVRIAKLKMSYDRAQMTIKPGGHFYESEQEIVRLKNQQESADKLADERIDELGRKIAKHLP